MFGSVRKMVSAFETRKRPHPPPPSHSSPSSSTQNPSLKQQTTPPSCTPTTVLKTLPCLSTTPEPLSPHSSGHAHFACPISHPVMSERPHDGERERQDVVLRGGGEGRRIPRVRLRDSWPMGKLNSIERNFLSFVTVETKEPIICSKCPPEFDRSRLRPIGCKSTSTTGLNTTSTAGLNTTSTAELNTTSTAELNTNTTSTAGLNTTSTAELNTTSNAGLNTTSNEGLNTTSTAELNTTSNAGLNTTSTARLNTTSAARLNTTSAARLNTTSATELKSTSTARLNTTSTTELKSTSTAGLNTTSTAVLNTTYTAGPVSTVGTNASSAISTTASFPRGISSRFTAETGSKLILGASASANSDSELLLSLRHRGPVLVGGANKSVFEPPGDPVYPKKLVLGTAAAVTQSGGRGQGKGRAFQPQLGLRPSDSTFFSLLLLLRSGSSNSMIAIDNKIEQAMDLVKAHLMLAVREEVEVLREQIKELAERNAQLERENYILRALRENQ